MLWVGSFRNGVKANADEVEEIVGPVELRRVSGMDKGLFATRDVDPGELFVSTAITSVTHPAGCEHGDLTELSLVSAFEKSHTRISDLKDFSQAQLLVQLDALEGPYPTKSVTCLGGGEDGELSSPTSFMLDICRSKVLLECPIDLSALLLFLPTVLPGKERMPDPPDVKNSARGERMQSSSSLALAGTDSFSVQGGKRHLKGIVGFGEHPESLLPASKLPRVGTERTSTHVSCSPNKSDKTQKQSNAGLHRLSPLDAAPWYKTPDFRLLDISLIDAVIISNPLAMMGLPFLVRDPEFTAKIYATDVTAKLGQLLMEELVILHSEFVELYGQRVEQTSPPWLQSVPSSELEEQVPGATCRGQQWHRLYSTANIRACMARVHGLRYGEEANINGCLKIKPSSSGFGLGSCNWVIKGAHRSLTYISTSSLNPNHSMPLDLPALGGCEVLLFSCPEVAEALQEESGEARKEAGVALHADKTPDPKVVQTASDETHQVTEGGTVQKQSSQRHSGSPASSLSPAPVGSTAGNSASTQKPVSSLLVSVPSEKSVKSASDEQEIPKQSSSLTVDYRIKAVCRAGVEAVGAGGSVLFPISLYGSFLEILEEMSVQLRLAGIEVPIMYISPVAEKLLALVNTIPEWVCPARQEKLYAGEALFGFAEAVQEKRLHRYPALHTPDLLRCWQEPCVVFASHWSLHVGSALQLLHRWRNDPLCLLILTEPNVNPKVLLEPLEPYAIQVLHQPILSNITSPEVASIIQTLKPRLTLVPERLRHLESSQKKGAASLGGVSCYKLLQPYKVPPLQYDLEVEMSADLALQIQLKQIKSGKVAAARLSADLHHRDGRWSLEMPSPSSYSGSSLRSLPRHLIRWGKIDVDSLLRAFRERQMHDVYVTERTIQDDQNLHDQSDSKEVIIEITSPSPAKIEITSTRINVHANEAALRRLIVEVLNSALSVL